MLTPGLLAVGAQAAHAAEARTIMVAALVQTPIELVNGYLFSLITEPGRPALAKSLLTATPEHARALASSVPLHRVHSR